MNDALARTLAVLTLPDDAVDAGSWDAFWRRVLTYASPSPRIELDPVGVRAYVLSGTNMATWLGPFKWTATDPDAAWERLATAGVIPHDAVDDPRRSFPWTRRDECPECGCPCEGDGPAGVCACDAACRVCYGSATRAYPETMAQIAVLASRWREVLAAEALAAEACAAYGVRFDAIVWRVGDLPGVTEGPSLPPAMAIRALGFAVERMDEGRIVLACPEVAA